MTISGTGALTDSTLQVSVTVRNDSTAPISFSYGPCGDLEIALYTTPTHVDQPVWPRVPYMGAAMCLSMAVVQVEPGQSRTVTGAVPFKWAAQGSGAIAAGTYYVTAHINVLVGNEPFPGDTVDVGTLTMLPVVAVSRQVGALTYTGASLLADSILHVAVTIENDSTTPVTIAYGPGLEVALVQAGTQTGSPWAYLWTFYPTGVMSCLPENVAACPWMSSVQIEVGQSRTITEAISLSGLLQSGGLPSGTYDVTALRGFVNAGAITIR